MTVMPERIVAGRYLLRDTLGRGGMGVVWLAHDRLLDREVAVKEITFPELLPEDQRESMRARVLREARAAARLNHPGAITLYDVLEEQGRAFIVMELITAPTLADLVASEGPLPPERVARIGLQIASVLDAAHRAGIVHRDVKPANVMVGEDGGVWLADFGVARLQEDPRLTTSGMIVGSPWYMAPEQAADGDIGPATDLWGLGATMYYAVEGRAPFERASSLAALAAVVNEPPPPPEHAGPLAPLLMSLLAKDPADRPALRQVRIRLARVAGAGGRGRAGTGRPDRAGAGDPAGDRPAAAVAAADLFTPAGTGEPPAGPILEPPAEPGAEAPTGPAASEPPASAADGPERGDGRARRRLLTALGLLAGVAVIAGVAAVVLALALHGSLRGNEAGGRRGATATNTNAPTTSEPPPTTAPATTSTGSSATTTTRPPKRQSTEEASAVPADWTRFANPSGGYAVAYPSGWSRSTGLARHGTSFREAAGRFIKVESAHPPQVPPSGDPLPGWIDNERYWSARLPGYQRIGSVHRGTYHGMRAAIWEYRYTPNGRATHGLNISFVSPSGSWGYSVLSLIPEDRWDSSQDLIRSFEQSFTPLA
jgi:eukaryotic-like serine/threonine-protein kinase